MTLLPALIQTHFGTMEMSTVGLMPLRRVIAGLASGALTRAERLSILSEAGVQCDPQYIEAETALVLSFFTTSVNGRRFGPEEAESFEILKLVCDVREGAFLRYCRGSLVETLESQLEAILADQIVDPAEDEYQARLQDALDLGLDQYMALCGNGFKRAALNLQEALERETRPAERDEIQRRMRELEPTVRIAELQQ